LRTNSGMALLSAVDNAEGIAFMPTYVAALDRGLVALDLPVQLRFDIFLAYASDLRHAKPIVETVHWLREIFHPARCPWFAEHFVHPRDIPHNAAAMAVEASGLLDNGIR
jgi:DNA-binding transcriptional LysR family regulator